MDLHAKASQWPIVSIQECQLLIVSDGMLVFQIPIAHSRTEVITKVQLTERNYPSPSNDVYVVVHGWDNKEWEVCNVTIPRNLKGKGVIVMSLQNSNADNHIKNGKYSLEIKM